MVTDTAADGDSVARAIIDRGAEELATMVATVAAKLGMANAMNRVPVTVTGGLTNAREAFMNPLANAIRRRVRQAVVVEPKLPPVLGAVMLAIELAGTPVSSDIVDRLIEGHSSGQQVRSAK
jgi:N-acetylglucosamine kinase-like BadF-type ATPase